MNDSRVEAISELNHTEAPYSPAFPEVVGLPVVADTILGLEEARRLVSSPTTSQSSPSCSAPLAQPVEGTAEVNADTITPKILAEVTRNIASFMTIRSVTPLNSISTAPSPSLSDLTDLSNKDAEGKLKLLVVDV